MGFGIINPDIEEPKMFIYSIGTKTQPQSIDISLFNDANISMWDYAIGEETIGLEPGEEKVIAVYRQANNQIRVGYDYQDETSIKEMINEDKNVLLLKIKVEEINE
jgi:hypothetical protein